MQPAPGTFVLFGSTGDLAQRKILPALCSLYQKHLLPSDFRLVAFSRRDWDDTGYHDFAVQSLAAFPADVVADFLARTVHVRGTFDDAASFQTLKAAVMGRALYYIAVQPALYADIVSKLGEAGLGGRILIEKPFGTDLASAEMLEALIEKYFQKEDIFRLDHYLAKAGLDAMVQYRKEHPEFEARLNNASVVSVTSRIFESLDVGGRGEFYDAVGALVDVGQGHLLLMLATFLAGDVARDALPQARAQALEQLLPVATPAHVVRAQYAGYSDERGVNPDSETETYFRAMTESTDARWQGTELVFEGGKAFAHKKSEIEIIFTDATQHIFPMDIAGGAHAHEVVIQVAYATDASRSVSWDEIAASWTFVMSAKKLLPSVPLLVYPKGGEAPVHNV